MRIFTFVTTFWFGIAFADDTVDQPLPPDEAAATMIVPEGFSVTVFAAEPDVVQPIDFCLDDRGRLWVAEALSYPKHTDDPAQDRITIFEDTDGDGKHDKRTVFYDQLNYVTGIEVGFGGAWVMSPPHFFFIPDKNGDDIPDGEPEVVLDGFGNHANSHNLANGFEWGPDGWLYGTHGRTNWSLIGKPGTPEDERVRFDGGVWRFDPVSREWESWCDGTTNPWGIDWDDTGEAFITNCVNPHLFHAIQGAHYEPWRGRKSSQHAYERIQTIADHLHYEVTGDLRKTLGSDETLSLGGGHAHCGVLVYPRHGTTWPEEFRGAVFMNNIHGDRINVDVLKRTGSGYTASHGPDLMISKDPWFMGVALHLAPDGESIYVSDWSDTGECHSTRNTRKKTGRIYKISYGEPKVPELDLAEKTSLKLAELAISDNRFLERHARRILWERAEAGEEMDEVADFLKEQVYTRGSDNRLKALMAFFLMKQQSLEPFWLRLLSDRQETIRARAVQLICEERSGMIENGLLLINIFERFEEIARSEKSARVLLKLISGAMQIHWDDGFNLGEIVLVRANLYEDDPNLQLMLWYLLEKQFELNPEAFSKLCHSRIPMFRKFGARRIASDLEGRKYIGKYLECNAYDSERQKDVFAGMVEGLKGVRDIEMPERWKQIRLLAERSTDAEFRTLTLKLALIFGDSDAKESMEKSIQSETHPASERAISLTALIDKRPDNLDTILLKLLNAGDLQAIAIRGLAKYNNPETPTKILDLYPKLDAATKQDALQTLASRPAWAAKLLDAVGEEKTIPRTDVTAFTARQIMNLKDEDLTKKVREEWGELKSSSAEKEKQMADYRKKLTPDSIKKADAAAGRAHYQKLCAACHKLFGEGGVVGPELTGSQRNNLDYLLENLVDPSASVSKDFQMRVIETTDGRTVTGFAESDNETALTIRSVNEKIVIPKKEIKAETLSEVSIMPEGLLNTLTTQQIRELVAYLASPRQVGSHESNVDSAP